MVGRRVSLRGRMKAVKMADAMAVVWVKPTAAMWVVSKGGMWAALKDALTVVKTVSLRVA